VSYARWNAYASAKHEDVRKAPALLKHSRALSRPLDILRTGVISSDASQGSVEMSWHLRRMVVEKSVLLGSYLQKCRWALRWTCCSPMSSDDGGYACWNSMDHGEQRLLEDFMLTLI
jgi:hypothetical protein